MLFARAQPAEAELIEDQHCQRTSLQFLKHVLQKFFRITERLHVHLHSPIIRNVLVCSLKIWHLQTCQLLQKRKSTCKKHLDFHISFALATWTHCVWVVQLKKRIKRSPLYSERVTLMWGLAIQEITPHKAYFLNNCFWAPSLFVYMTISKYTPQSENASERRINAMT